MVGMPPPEPRAGTLAAMPRVEINGINHSSSVRTTAAAASATTAPAPAATAVVTATELRDVSPCPYTCPPAFLPPRRLLPACPHRTTCWRCNGSSRSRLVACSSSSPTCTSTTPRCVGRHMHACRSGMWPRALTLGAALCAARLACPGPATTGRPFDRLLPRGCVPALCHRAARQLLLHALRQR